MSFDLKDKETVIWLRKGCQITKTIRFNEFVKEINFFENVDF